MSRSWLAVAATMAFATGCSHQQKVEATSGPISQAALGPARKVAVAAPSVPVAPDVPKSKEGNAIFFDFDSALVKDDARPVLQQIAEGVRKQNGTLEVEGNCDELGTVEYNLALGEHRARAAKEYLMRLGVPANHISTVSYGSQRPKYPGHSDEDRARNRRDDLVVRR
jgi:peptidoglycan-associated lipoprotein